ncbi:adenylate/guanylate cyclase domain-containing protein [Shimia aestuarii]|uniref:adenylate/guanylate cyclase domain-containing protein n=1 Tax=Shimia aestuarii TaxID=254406 RepID=UPI000B868361|nr:adenylate/guanylate cyclase domain-containing protein [Shimia aestuarii]
MKPHQDIPDQATEPSPDGTQERVVLFIDMVSYSQRIGEDEAATLEFMSACFDTLRILARRYQGKLVKTLGDGAMLLFDEAHNAIEYGVEFQRIVTKLQTAVADPYVFRVGVHKGAVLIHNGDAFGNTVNVAARLQSVAAPGRCVVSQIVYELAHDVIDLEFEALGAPALKNIRERIPVYGVVDPLLQRQFSERPAVPQIEVLKGAFIARGPALNHDVRLLLGYLALCPGHADSLERLAALLGGQGAAARVADAVLALEGDHGFLGRAVSQFGGLVALDPVALETDLDILLRDLRQNRVPELLLSDAEWPQRILAGFREAGPVFAGWRRVIRATWKRRLMHEMERLLERSSSSEDVHEDAADAMLLLEPGNEIAAEARIRVRIARGDQGGALAEFERLEQYLAETYGVAPGERIRALVSALVKKGGQSLLRPATSRPRRLLRIAVGGFEGNGQAVSEQLAAFRGDLIANLARFRDWSVIDSLVGDEGQTVIDYRVDGRSTGQGGAPTLALTLNEHASGRTLWAEAFTVSSDAWERSQREIIRRIAATIESYISADRLAIVLGARSDDVTSHDAWLRGDRALMRWTPEGAEEARAIFEGILEKDPDHTPSLYRLASISNVQHVIWPGRARRSAEDAEADRFASRAVDLDPMDARVQRTVAWTAAMNGAFARATMHMDLAVSLNPNSPTSLASCAMGFAWFGEQEKADAALTRCLSIAPLLPEWGWAYNAATYFVLGRLDEALEAAELGGDSIADTQGWIAAAHARRGDTSAAGAAFRRFVAMISPAWSGPEPVTFESAADWFAEAYPLRYEDDRTRLSEAIHTARRAA